MKLFPTVVYRVELRQDFEKAVEGLIRFTERTNTNPPEHHRGVFRGAITDNTFHLQLTKSNNQKSIYHAIGEFKANKGKITFMPHKRYFFIIISTLLFLAFAFITNIGTDINYVFYLQVVLAFTLIYIFFTKVMMPREIRLFMEKLTPMLDILQIEKEQKIEKPIPANVKNTPIPRRNKEEPRYHKD